jgi:RimJ/RimL family protein N-acetyltransferase
VASVTASLSFYPTTAGRAHSATATGPAENAIATFRTSSARRAGAVTGPAATPAHIAKRSQLARSSSSPSCASRTPMQQWSQTRFGAAKSEATGCKARHQAPAARTSVQAPGGGFPKRLRIASPTFQGVIETERLLLRAWQPSDETPFAALNADAEVTRYLRGPMRRDESDELLAAIRRHWQDHGFGLHAVEIRQTGAFAGFVGLAIPSFLPAVLPAVEVGWRLAREHWGHGYATEGAGASLAHGFGELGLAQIISLIDPRNAASIRVAERLGMARGTERVHPLTRVRLAAYFKDADGAA